MAGCPRLHLDFTALQLIRTCTSSPDAASGAGVRDRRARM